jgi:hypothetical protein
LIYIFQGKDKISGNLGDRVAVLSIDTNEVRELPSAPGKHRDGTEAAYQNRKIVKVIQSRKLAVLDCEKEEWSVPDFSLDHYRVHPVASRVDNDSVYIVSYSKALYRFLALLFLRSLFSLLLTSCPLSPLSISHQILHRFKFIDKNSREYGSSTLLLEHWL